MQRQYKARAFVRKRGKLLLHAAGEDTPAAAVYRQLGCCCLVASYIHQLKYTQMLQTEQKEKQREQRSGRRSAAAAAAAAA